MSNKLTEIFIAVAAITLVINSNVLMGLTLVVFFACDHLRAKEISKVGDKEATS